MDGQITQGPEYVLVLMAKITHRTEYIIVLILMAKVARTMELMR